MGDSSTNIESKVGASGTLTTRKASAETTDPTLAERIDALCSSNGCTYGRTVTDSDGVRLVFTFENGSSFGVEGATTADAVAKAEKRVAKFAAFNAEEE